MNEPSGEQGSGGPGPVPDGISQGNVLVVLLAVTISIIGLLMLIGLVSGLLGLF